MNQINSQWPRSWWQHYKYLHGYYYYYYHHHYPMIMLKVQLAPSHVMVMRRKLVVYCLQCTKFKSLSLIILPLSVTVVFTDHTHVLDFLISVVIHLHCIPDSADQQQEVIISFLWQACILCQLSGHLLNDPEWATEMKNRPNHLLVKGSGTRLCLSSVYFCFVFCFVFYTQDHLSVIVYFFRVLYLCFFLVWLSIAATSTITWC